MHRIYHHSRFLDQSTTEDVLAGVDLKGKRILVTGVSAGLGVETARALVAHRADVVGAVRDLEKAKRATSEVSKTAAKSGASFEASLPCCTPVKPFDTGHGPE